jgi:hypothetical protein
LSNQNNVTADEYNSLSLTIGFGAANAVFSSFAYVLIEKPPRGEPGGNTRGRRQLPRCLLRQRWLLGRRSLLLTSLIGGTIMLFILIFLLNMDKGNPAKLPVVVTFLILFTFFYSPGAGCVPFLYSAEVWPNEGRGMLCLNISLLPLVFYPE